MRPANDVLHGYPGSRRRRILIRQALSQHGLEGSSLKQATSGRPLAVFSRTIIWVEANIYFAGSLLKYPSDQVWSLWNLKKWDHVDMTPRLSE